MSSTSSSDFLTVWRLVDDGPEHAALVGDHAFWRWPPDQLWPVARGYGLVGVGVVLVVALLVWTARTSFPGPDGLPIMGWRTSQLGVALLLGLAWVGLPVAWGLRPSVRWEARPGRLDLAGQTVQVQAGVELGLASYQTTSRHGQGVQRSTFTYQLMEVELRQPDGTRRVLGTFGEEERGHLGPALRRLAEVSGAGFVERGRD